MSDETNTQPGGGEAVPAATQDPKADALAVAPKQEPDVPAKAPEPSAEEKAQADAAKADEDKKRNRTRDYINRINRENAELRQRAAEWEAQQKQTPQPRAQQPDKGPTLEQFKYDLHAYQQARDQWVIEQAQQGWKQEHSKAEQERQQQETWSTYEQRAADFAEAHPDYLEVVGSIAYPLPEALQVAIAAHPQGPDIAYHLGNNDDDAFALASIQPHLAAAAVQRLASRLGAAPVAAAVPAAAAAVPPQPKPITQAPPPAPQVSGRAVTDTPPDKLTDEDWWKREQAKPRKR